MITAFDQDQRFVPLQIKECTLGCDSILESHVNADDDPRAVFLRAGRYVLKLWRYDDGDPAEIAVTAEGMGCE